MSAKKQAILEKQSRSYQPPSGVQFIDVGKTPAREYLQELPKRNARLDHGKVLGPGAPGAIRVLLAEGHREEELSAVLPCGWEQPKVGSEVRLEIIDGAAFIRAPGGGPSGKA